MVWIPGPPFPGDSGSNTVSLRLTVPISEKTPEDLCFRNMTRQKTVGRAACLRQIPLNHRNSIQVPCLTCTVQMYNASCLSVVPVIPVASFFVSLCLLVSMSLSLYVHLSLCLYVSMSL